MKYGNKKYPGVKLTITASLDKIRQEISMDIGFGDVVTPHPSDLDYPNLLNGFPDTSIWTYSLATVIAEKFQTLIVRAETNSRMKDFYDLYTILQGEDYDVVVLSEAIKATFENRQTNYMENHVMFTHSFVTNTDLSIRWSAFMKKLRAPIQPTFSEVMEYIQGKLKPYWEILI